MNTFTAKSAIVAVICIALAQLAPLANAQGLDVSNLYDSLDSMRAIERDLQSDLRTAESDVASAKSNVNKAESAIGEARLNLSSARQKSELLQSEYFREKERVDAKEERLTTLRQRVELDQASLRSLRERLNDAKAALENAKQRFNRAKQQNASRSTRDQLASYGKQQQKKYNDLVKQYNSLRADINNGINLYNEELAEGKEMHKTADSARRAHDESALAVNDAEGRLSFAESELQRHRNQVNLAVSNADTASSRLQTVRTQISLCERAINTAARSGSSVPQVQDQGLVGQSLQAISQGALSDAAATAAVRACSLTSY